MLFKYNILILMKSYHNGENSLCDTGRENRINISLGVN